MAKDYSTKGARSGKNFSNNFKAGKDLTQAIKNSDSSAPNAAQSSGKPRYNKPATRQNHAEWYILNGFAAKDFGSFPYGNKVGAKQTLANGRSLLIPGIAIVEYSPMFGANTLGSAPLNAMKRRLNTFIRSANSRTASYDSNDVIISQLAALNLYALSVYIRRFFGLCKFYSFKNATLPKMLCERVGIDYDDLIANHADYRARFNNIMYVLASLKVPSGMTLLDRWKFLNESVFTDADTFKTQFIVYRMRTFYQWSAVDKDTGSALKAVDVPFGKTVKMSTLLDLLEESIYLMLDDSDVQAMQNDIAHAFEASQCYIPAPVFEDYATPLIPDPNIKSQLASANLTPIRPKYVYQETAGGNIVYELESTCVVSSEGSLLDVKLAQGAYVNMHKLDVTPEDTIVALVDAVQYTALFDEYGGLISGDIITSGPEVIHRFLAYYGTEFDNSADEYYSALLKNENGLVTSDSGNLVSMGTAFDALVRYLAFDWAPYVYSTMDSCGVANNVAWRPENAIILSGKDVSEVHDNIWYKLLDIPLQGKFNMA